MDFLPQANKVCEGDTVPDQILATGKRVVIIGGGDTGADCLGTSHRQGAAHITQFELMPKPPERTLSGNAVADVADAAARGEFARRRRPPRLERQHGEVLGRCRWQREKAPRRPRGMLRRSSKRSRARSSNSMSIWFSSPWASPVRCARACWTNWASRWTAAGM
jgi:cation diffusion facilitator CzcD-associated flavoprotein CzcO